MFDNTAWLIVAAGVAMCARDIVSTAETYFVSRSKIGLAIIADCFSDTAVLFSIGAPLAVMATRGISLPTAAAFFSMWTGSIVGTWSGLVIAKALCIEHEKERIVPIKEAA